MFEVHSVLYYLIVIIFNEVGFVYFKKYKLYTVVTLISVLKFFFEQI
jgi:hypothetical protein